MSTYSTTTESNININKQILNDDLNYKKLQKFNKFYLTNSNFSCKENYKSQSKKSKPIVTGNIYNINLKNPLITRKSKISEVKPNNKNIHSRNYNSSHKPLTKYKTFTNYNNKMKNLFNPEILDGVYISKPKKIKIKTTKIEMPKFKTFLANKIKDKSLSIKISNCIINNLSKFILPNKSFINKSTTNIKIKQKINYQRNDFYKDSRLYAARKHRNTVYNIINKFKQKLNYDKKENLNDYNNFMNSLRTNLSLSKCKNLSNYFAYE